MSLSFRLCDTVGDGVDSAASDNGLDSVDELDSARKLAVDSGVLSTVVASEAVVEAGEAVDDDVDDEEKEKADDDGGLLSAELLCDPCTIIRRRRAELEGGRQQEGR